MKVQIINEEGKVIWERNQANNSGILSRGYIKDGTQEKIIDALDHALKQAKGQLLTLNEVDRVFDVSSATT